MTKAPIINEQLEMLNHLIAHQNAAIDLLASDKRAALTTDLEAVAELIHAGELLEVMDYGDQLMLPWKDTNNDVDYTPPLNLCHVEEAELEDGEIIPVADFEWHYTIPFEMPFDAPEAIFNWRTLSPQGPTTSRYPMTTGAATMGKPFSLPCRRNCPPGIRFGSHATTPLW